MDLGSICRAISTSYLRLIPSLGMSSIFFTYVMPLSSATTYRKTSLISLSVSSSLKDLSSFCEVQLLQTLQKNTSWDPYCVVPRLQFFMYLFFMTFLNQLINSLRTKSFLCWYSSAVPRAHSKCSVSFGSRMFSSKRENEQGIQFRDLQCSPGSRQGIDEVFQLLLPTAPNPILLTNELQSLFSK